MGNRKQERARKEAAKKVNVMAAVRMIARDRDQARRSARKIQQKEEITLKRLAERWEARQHMRDRHWAGMEILPYSRLDHVKPVKIDRVQVRYYETITGEGYFQVEGGRRDQNEWYPLCTAHKEGADAWKEKEKIEKALRAAAQEDRERGKRQIDQPGNDCA